MPESQACNISEKETLTLVFSCEFCEISKNTFFTEHLWTTASEAAEFRCAVGLTTILRLLQRNFLYLQFLLLLSERGLSPESCLVFSHPWVSCL